VHDAPRTAETAEKFHIFHNRHVRKPLNSNKSAPPTKHSVIAAPYPQKQPGIVRKGVGQPVHDWRWQANPEKTANDSWIEHDAANLIQTV
jgi:hypothetical protein